jgi:hypothetical protein
MVFVLLEVSTAPNTGTRTRTGSQGQGRLRKKIRTLDSFTDHGVRLSEVFVVY